MVHIYAMPTDHLRKKRFCFFSTGNNILKILPVTRPVITAKTSMTGAYPKVAEVPIRNAAAVSWPKLWEQAQSMPMPENPKGHFLLLRRKYITTVLSIPPQKLISAAEKPLVIKANTALAAVMPKAQGRLMLSAANMVMIFENPGFAPGGSPGIGGIMLSRKEKARACAVRIPMSAVFAVRLSMFTFICASDKLIGDNVNGRILSRYYPYKHSGRKAGSSIALMGKGTCGNTDFVAAPRGHKLYFTVFCQYFA